MSAIVPPFYAIGLHGVLTESLTNLADTFWLGIAKFLAKFHAGVADHVTPFYNLLGSDKHSLRDLTTGFPAHFDPGAGWVDLGTTGVIWDQTI